VLKRVEDEEDAYFVLMLSIMAINASAPNAPASVKLDISPWSGVDRAVCVSSDDWPPELNSIVERV
jgi:hypothetical protein